MTAQSTTDFELSFKFAREGFNGGYSGGTATIPCTAFTEDNASLDVGDGVIATVDSRITAVTFQFISLAGDATAKYRIDGGSWVDLGTVVAVTKFNTFYPLDIPVSAGSDVEFGFSSGSSGSFLAPTVTAYIRNQVV